MYHPLVVPALIGGASGGAADGAASCTASGTASGTSNSITSGIITDVVTIVNYNAFVIYSHHARCLPAPAMATPFNDVCWGVAIFSNLMNLTVLRFLWGTYSTA